LLDFVLGSAADDEYRKWKSIRLRADKDINYLSRMSRIAFNAFIRVIDPNANVLVIAQRIASKPNLLDKWNTIYYKMHFKSESRGLGSTAASVCNELLMLKAQYIKVEDGEHSRCSVLVASG
jgi:hypothetical protein